jgi:HD-like signal output (HDOD) protein
VLNLKSTVEALSRQDLPVLRQTLDELKRLRSEGDRITGRDVSRIVIRDPMMTLRVLRYAESQRTKRQPTDITTVEHAVMMHGVNAFFANFSQLKTIDDVLAGYPEALEGALAVISRAYQASIIAGQIAAARHDMELDEVIISTLLHEMAEMLLWICMPESAIHLKHIKDRSEGLRSASVQRIVLGFPLVELQTRLARSWSLPQLLQSLMDDLHAEKPRVLNVTFAAALARHTSHGWHNAAIPYDVKGVGRLIGGNGEAAHKVVTQALVHAARQWKYFGVRPNATWIPLEAGVWPEQPGTRSTLVGKVDAEALERSLQLLDSGGEDTKSDVSSQSDDIIGILLHGLITGAGLTRVAYGVVNHEKRTLEFKCTLMAGAGLSARELDFVMGSPHLFARIMDKTQGLWCGSATREKLLPHLPGPLATKLARTDFFCMSLEVGERLPTAFVYADSGDNGPALDAKRYADFKALSLLAGRRLHHIYLHGS